MYHMLDVVDENDLQYNKEVLQIKENSHFFDITSQLDVRFKVLEYLLNNRIGKISIGSLKVISEATGISISRVSSFLKLLEEKDLVQRHRNGVLRLSNKLLSLEDNALYESNLSKSVLRSNSPIISFRCNYDQQWTMHFISEGFFSLTGFTTYHFIQNKLMSFNDIIAPEFRNSIWREFRNKLANRLPIYYEYEIITATGQRKWVLEIAQGIYDAKERVQAIEGIIIDITDQKEHEIYLKSLREHNIWTGLYDRNYFVNFLRHDINMPVHEKRAILGVNLSDLNLISYDVKYIQRIIKKISLALSSYRTNNCQLFNTYLNRFAFYIKNYKDKNELKIFSEKIIEALESTLFNEMIGAGIGIIEIDNYNSDVEQILQSALIASEYALNSSEHKFDCCFFDKYMEAKLLCEEEK